MNHNKLIELYKKCISFVHSNNDILTDIEKFRNDWSEPKLLHDILFEAVDEIKLLRSLLLLLPSPPINDAKIIIKRN